MQSYNTQQSPKSTTSSWKCHSASDCKLNFRNLEITVVADHSKWLVSCPCLDIQNIQIVKACPVNRYISPESPAEARKLALDIVESRLLQYMSLMKEIKAAEISKKEGT